MVPLPGRRTAPPIAGVCLISPAAWCFWVLFSWLSGSRCLSGLRGCGVFFGVIKCTLGGRLVGLGLSFIAVWEGRFLKGEGVGYAFTRGWG